MNGLLRKSIFIDRNSGGRAFRDLVAKAGCHVVLHDDQFPPRTPDHVWLKKVGALGWAVVTGDVAVERSLLFLTALRRSEAHVFILCALNHSNAESRAESIINAYPAIAELCHSNAGKPCLWKAKTGCSFVPVNFKETLALLKRKFEAGADVRL